MKTKSIHVCLECAKQKHLRIPLCNQKGFARRLPTTGVFPLEEFLDTSFGHCKKCIKILKSRKIIKTDWKPKPKSFPFKSSWLNKTISE